MNSSLKSWLREAELRFNLYSGWLGQAPTDWEETVAAACREDWGTGDLTESCFPSGHQSRAYLEFQANGVACGLGIAAHLLPSSQILLTDGDSVAPGSIAVRTVGSTPEILRAERIALNFVMALSGTATLTRKFVDAVKGTSATIVDTRKTLPGLRSLQKYAVRCGGGQNHRMGLYDAAMLKDNHLLAAGSIKEAVQRLRASIPFTSKIEVECTTPEMVQEAVSAGADIVMLDNMSVATMRAVVQDFKGKVLLEASGGINLQSVREVAETGVDFISVGALTHSAVALSCHLEFESSGSSS